MVRTSDTRQRLVVVVHHLVADGVSFEIFVRDLLTACRARQAGRAPEFDPLPVQYADFTEWQRRRLATTEASADLAYWRDQLADLSTVDLTRGRPRPADLRHDGSEIAVDIPADVSDALRREAARRGGTLFIAFAALWAEAVGRWFGTTDVPIGTPLVGRPIPELTNVIGLFVDRAVLRLDRSGRPSFREMLARTRDVVFGANDHSAATFEQVVASIQPERRLGVTPLFQVGINLVPLTEISGGQFGNGTVRHDLNLELLPVDDGIAAKVEFRDGVVDRADAEGVADLFDRLLQFVVHDADAPLRTVPTCLDASGSIRDGGPPDRGGYTTVYQAFVAQSASTPDAIAVVAPRVRLSYRDLAQRAAALAEELMARDVAPETAVLLAAPRGAELIVGCSASSRRAVRTFRSIRPRRSAMSSEWPPPSARVSRWLPRARQPRFQPEWTSSPSTSMRTGGRAESTGSAPPVGPAAYVHPSNAAYVLFTSGTTGAPKGVVVEHRHVMAYTSAIRRLTGSGAGASYLMVQPATFDSCVTQIYGALLSGGTLHLVDEDLARDADGLADYCAEHPIDFLKIVPSHLSALLSSGRAGVAARASRHRWR